MTVAGGRSQRVQGSGHTSFAARSENCAKLVVGMVGGRDEQMAAIGLCRCYDGIVVLRTGDVIVIEVTGGEELQQELCRRLRAGTITHLCQRGEGAGLDFAGVLAQGP